MKTFDKIPVFLHIPKAAGTYIQSVIFKYLIRMNDNTSGYIRKITIENTTSNLTVYCNFLTDYWKTDINMKRHPISVDRNVDNPRAGCCSVDTFKTYLRNNQLTLLSVSVEPTIERDMRSGLFLAHDIIDIINGKAVNFTILRNSFDRQQSLYYYLTQGDSAHEPTHGKIKQKTFLDYLTSVNLEDSWLIRMLTGMPEEVEVNKHWYNTAINFINSHNFIISDIKNTDDTLDMVINNCTGIPLIKHDREGSDYNKTTYIKRINFSELTESNRDIFNNRVFWDQALYDHFIKK